MSYDLMVFDPTLVPNEGPAFVAWYDAQADADVDEALTGDIYTDFSDPDRTTPLLRSWFLDMIKEFPAMNGADAPGLDELDETERAADYSIDKASIYINFSWSDPDAAYEATFRLAAKHGVGFFDVSSEDGKVWIPESPGELKVAFKTS